MAISKVDTHISLRDRPLHVIEMKGDNLSGATVLFLHGASFSARTWLDLGTLAVMAEHKYRAIALDLPGYGSSARQPGTPLDFMLKAMDALEIEAPVLVSPSMSGNYSLPLVTQRRDRLKGWIPVAPVKISRYRQPLQGNPLPTLAVWGSNDHIVSPRMADLLVQLMPNAERVILKDAGHACYMREPTLFHEQVITFCDRLFA